MPVCQNGHDQPDFAKFCGTCGSSVSATLILEPDQVDSGLSDPGTTTPIDLDLMQDENDVAAEKNDLDDAIDEDVDTDDTAVELDATDDTDASDDSAVDTDDSDDASDMTVDTDDSDQAQVVPSMFGTTVNASAMQLLHDWAEENDVLDDPYIKGLTGAVTRRDDLSVWASLDPLELLPVSKSKAWSRLGHISNVISSIRNILVFVPVLLTWYAIGKALDAFGEFTKVYADQNPGGERDFSFIGFWQNPTEFAKQYLPNVPESQNLLSGSFWIGEVARLDALIILLIVLLTTISGVLTWFAESRESAELEKADRKRVEVGLAIASSLHGKRQANPESISEALAEALNDLTQAARDVNETASRLEQASLGVESLTPRIEILNTHTEQLVSQTATSVSKAVNDLVVSVQNLNSSVGGNVTSLFSEAASTLEEVSKQLARTSNSAEYGIKQLRDDLDAIHKQLQSLTKGGRL
jgi:prefoldin subunit 5